MAHFNMNATVSIWLSLKLKLNRLFALSPHTLLCAQFERSWIKYIYARSIHQNKENGNNKRKVVIFHFTNYFIISISRLHFIVAVFLINSKTLRFCDAEKLDRKKCPSISMRAWRIFRALSIWAKQWMSSQVYGSSISMKTFSRYKCIPMVLSLSISPLDQHNCRISHSDCTKTNARSIRFGSFRSMAFVIPGTMNNGDKAKIKN